VFDELFRNITVQLLITFHAGSADIGYEWGTFEHPRGQDTSPDNAAHSAIAESMSRFAGAFRGEGVYPAAPINTLVYPVHGGMEDWSYAAGWDSDLVVQCDGQSYSSPPPNRAVTFLVETSVLKSPPPDELGYDYMVLNNTQQNNNEFGGHVPRNTRLVLNAIDTSQPYVCISPNSTFITQFQEGIHNKPLRRRAKGTKSKTKRRYPFSFSWYVGGAFTVNRTWLAWHQNTDEPTTIPPEAWEEKMDSLIPPDPPTSHHSSIWEAPSDDSSLASGFLSGPGRWLWNNPLNPSSGHIFTVDSLSLPQSRRQKPQKSFKRGKVESWWLVAWAEVDISWGSEGQGYPKYTADGEAFPPQSHLSSARTDSEWTAINDLGVIKVRGRRYWPSDPVVVDIKYSGKKYQKSRIVGVRSHVVNCAWWDRYK